MKKSLFAIAAVTAFAGAAQAQSSVTVYGILDVGYAGANQRVASPGATGTVTKGTASQFQSGGAESTNRIGFRGTEDLGGGLAANFVFESSLNTTSENWSPQIRQGWAGLTQKGMGAVRIGTQNSLIWQLAAPMTVGQLNNLAGSVINATNVGAALSTDNVNATSGIAFTNRTQRTIQLDSERMAGFQAKAMYVMNNANTTQTTALSTNGVTTITGGVNDTNGWGLSLDYTGVPKLRVAAAYTALNAENPYTATSANVNGTGTYTSGAPTPVGANGFAQAGTNVRDNQTFAAAMYDFGILTAYVNYVNRKVTSQQTSNVYAKRSAQEIGVRSFITAKVEGWASVGNGRYTAYGANSPTANIAGYQLGANYWLSKRTNLYAIYGQAGTTSSSANSAMNTNNYAVGARHTF
jgi:predicted porin